MSTKKFSDFVTQDGTTTSDYLVGVDAGINKSFTGLALHGPVASLAALKAVTSAGRPSGMSIEVVAMSPVGGKFVWNSASTTAPDDVNVVIPNDITAPAAGRWKRADIIPFTITAAGKIDASILAQDIASTASPTFAGATITGASGVLTAAAGVVGSGAGLADLSNVTLTSPVTSDSLIYNGSVWINSPSSGSKGPAVNYYLDDTLVTDVSSANPYQIVTLSETPITITEVVDTITVNNNLVFKEAYLHASALGVTSISPGTWEFYTYCGATGGGVCTLVTAVHKVVYPNGTVTFSGSGGTRTAAVTGVATPFTAGMATADLSTCSYIQTSQGLYPITTYGTNVSVTIGALAGTANSASSPNAWSIWTLLFTEETVSIPTTSIALLIASSAQAQFTLNATDGLGMIKLGRKTSAGNSVISYTHNGSSRYSFVASPNFVTHNNLPGLQGGTATERYHLNSAPYAYANVMNQTVATTASPTFAGATVGTLAGVIKGTAGTLSGSAVLNDLSNVNAGSPSGGDVLTWSSGSSKWINSAGGSSIPSMTDGQLIIGKTGGTPSYAVAALTGTSNEITVTPGSGTITLSTPQAIATTSTPTFAEVIIKGAVEKDWFYDTNAYTYERVIRKCFLMSTVSSWATLATLAPSTVTNLYTCLTVRVKAQGSNAAHAGVVESRWYGRYENGAPTVGLIASESTVANPLEVQLAVVSTNNIAIQVQGAAAATTNGMAWVEITFSPDYGVGTATWTIT